MNEAISIEKYLKLLERYSTYKNVYYRGQLEKYSTIIPSVLHKKVYFDNEQNIFNEAIRLAPDDFIGLNLPIEILSKMQHYDLPTRLIDITTESLHALYFAVENIDDESPGNVHVFIHDAYEMDSIESKAISLLAKNKYCNFDKLCLGFAEEYSEEISVAELKVAIANPIFIKYSDMLAKSNPRLFSQKGTFVLCTNHIEDNSIRRELKTLDDIKSTMIIRIPYEHKTEIKKELDEKYNINETIIYPELTSVASYIRNKYEVKSTSLDDAYNIMDEHPINIVNAKRISVKIVLKRLFNIEEIKKIASLVMKNYSKENDVIWLFVFRSEQDYIVSNYIIRTQWINPKLEERYRPTQLKNTLNINSFYVYGEAYSTLADYYSKHVFQDDKSLLIAYKINFDSGLVIFNYINKNIIGKNTKEVMQIIIGKKKQIRELYTKKSDFGRSQNPDLEKYFRLCDSFFSSFDNLHVWCENQNANEKVKEIQIKKIIEKLEKYIREINDGYKFWEHELGIKESDYTEYNPILAKRNEYQYTPTVPINEKAIDVYFNENICINPDNTFVVSGTTNIFDYAQLMISIRDENDILKAGGKTTVLNSKFEFPQISNKGEGYCKGIYKGSISISLPSVQPKEFVKQAGIEYENLKGKCVDRKGIGPSVNYEFTFKI